VVGTTFAQPLAEELGIFAIASLIERKTTPAFLSSSRKTSSDG
jgi:hypothetical protein